MSVYRLYIDESGHHRYKLAGSMAERYLGLCGIVIERNVYTREVVPRIEAMRSLFYEDPDEKPCFHLEDIMGRRNAFSGLRDPATQQRFNDLLLSLYSDVDYRIITVVIDKTRHYNQYVTPEHPYHYSLACMLERY